MKLLLDTHLLIWQVGKAKKLSAAARGYLDNPENELLFSAANIWEIAIKYGRGRDDFRIDPRLMRRGLLDHGYIELPITSAHAAAVERLPPLHKDPFDRILVAQSEEQEIILLTADPLIAQYRGLVRGV